VIPLVAQAAPNSGGAAASFIIIVIVVIGLVVIAAVTASNNDPANADARAQRDAERAQRRAERENARNQRAEAERLRRAEAEKKTHELRYGGVGKPDYETISFWVTDDGDRFGTREQMEVAIHQRFELVRLILDCKTRRPLRLDIRFDEVIDLERGCMQAGDPLNFMTIISTNKYFPAVSLLDRGHIYHHLRSALRR
jgi:hypothetical protein